jgi:hypothetical protein
MTHSTLSFLCQQCSASIEVARSSAAEFLRKSPKVLCSTCKSNEAQSKPTAISSYNSWYGLKRRCDCPTQTGYERYGGRNITYDPKWSTFDGFYEDMGDRPGPNYDLDRIDNDGNYCKENCRWVTHAENCKNRGGRRPTRLYTFNGKTLCISDWAKEIGITPQSLQKRLNKGWPLEIALSPERRDGDHSKHVVKTEPTSKGKTVRNKNSKFITIDGTTKTYSEWEKEKGLSKGLISKRIQQGCTEYEAVTKPMSTAHQNIRKK